MAKDKEETLWEFDESEAKNTPEEKEALKKQINNDMVGLEISQSHVIPVSPEAQRATDEGFKELGVTKYDSPHVKESKEYQDEIKKIEKETGEK